MIKIQGTSSVYRWTNDYLFQVLTSGKNTIISDPIIAAAFRKVDRADFVPEMLKNRAYEDIDLDIGYGETLTRPTVVAQMLSHMKPKYGGKYLDIGTGTGYFAVLLGLIAGDEGRVYTIERIQWVWEMARASAKKYEKHISNIMFLYRDGTEGLVNQAPFDGIHVAFAMKSIPENLKMQLSKEGGKLIVPTTEMDFRVVQRNGEDEFIEEIVQGTFFREGQSGTA